MATINIGSLSFTHKGDYASGTAYVKNDVVYYSTNGNAYIAKTSTTGNAPTSTAHWDLFAAGSGGIWNAGLSLGSAGQAVKVNSAGNALEFGQAGGLIQSAGAVKTNSQSFNTYNSRVVVSQLDVTLPATPSASSKLLIMGNIDYGFDTGDPSCSIRWEYSADNSTWYGDKYLGNHTGNNESKANWAGSSWRYNSFDHENMRYVASVNAIIAVSDLTVTTPRYFRVTLAQTDNSGNSIQIGTGQGVGSAPYPISTSSFNVIELGA